MLGVEGLLAYLDDLLLHTQDVDYHLKLLCLVLQAHRESGFKLNPEKTCPFGSKVEYLGYEVSTAGIKLIPVLLTKCLTGHNQLQEEIWQCFWVLLIITVNFLSRF